MVDPGLAARRGMQVDDRPQARLMAPLHQPVEERPARSLEPIIRIRRIGVARFDEQPPIERHANSVETGRFDEGDVVLGDVNVAKLRPEARSRLGADQGVEQLRDLRRAQRMFELEHVAFGHQPVAEIDALHRECLTAAIDQAFAVGMDEAGLGGGGAKPARGDDNRRADQKRDPARQPSRPATIGIARAHLSNPLARLDAKFMP